jgi:SpoOM protein
VLGLAVDQGFPGEKVRLRLGGTATRLVLVPPLPGTPARLMADPPRHRYPAVHLDLADQSVTPGGRLIGEVRLHGCETAVDIECVWALLYARVYSMFDDDTGAEQVRLFDGSISQEIRLAARQHIGIPLRLPVAWHTPVTRGGR